MYSQMVAKISMMIPLLQHTVDNFSRQAVAYAMLGYLPNRNHGNYYMSFTSLCKACCSIFRERIPNLADIIVLRRHYPNTILLPLIGKRLLTK